jgi:hypothetical protein
METTASPIFIVVLAAVACAVCILVVMNQRGNGGGRKNNYEVRTSSAPTSSAEGGELWECAGALSCAAVFGRVGTTPSPAPPPGHGATYIQGRGWRSTSFSETQWSWSAEGSTRITRFVLPTGRPNTAPPPGSPSYSVRPVWSGGRAARQGKGFILYFQPMTVR